MYTVVMMLFRDKRSGIERTVTGLHRIKDREASVKVTEAGKRTAA
jgi:hypothetical protein